jgi:NAD(P)-dependent dehydrogenase (short-subunit alcohol dehydrogenase family)
MAANIRSNIVLPGTVRTPFWERRIGKGPILLETLRKWYPLGRIVDPIDIAHAVAFLASDAAARSPAPRFPSIAAHRRATSSWRAN